MSRVGLLTLTFLWSASAIALGENTQTSGEPFGLNTTIVFVGPGNRQPMDQEVYSTIAFPYVPIKGAKSRFGTICEGVIRGWQQMNGRSGISTVDTVVTVWPVSREAVAQSLNDEPSCEKALAHLDLHRSRKAINRVRSSDRIRLTGDGPFLVAWSKAAASGESESMLVLNLSAVKTEEEAARSFFAWSRELGESPKDWNTPLRWRERLRQTKNKLGDILGF